MGFSLVESDNSIWVYTKEEIRIIIPVFVNDMTIAAQDKSSIIWVKDELKKRFKLRDLGPTSYLLTVSITRDRSQISISLSQRHYIMDILARYNFADCSPVQTPMDPGLKLTSDMCSQTKEERDYMATVPYINAVGALMYLAISTRPDIAYAVGVLCRFSANPGPTHWKAIKHLFRYLKGTVDYQLIYQPDSKPSSPLFTAAYSDANHGGNKIGGKSTTGYVIKIGTSAISWSSKLQSIIALSTTEAEYIASCSTAIVVIWLRHLLRDLGFIQTGPSCICIDNDLSLIFSKHNEILGLFFQYLLMIK